MPIYEYQCSACNNMFEALVPAGTKSAPCPACGSKKVAKRFSTFAAHQGSAATPCGDGACPGSSAGGGCGGGKCPYSM